MKRKRKKQKEEKVIFYKDRKRKIMRNKGIERK